jgi:hypothetical protein
MFKKPPQINPGVLVNFKKTECKQRRIKIAGFQPRGKIKKASNIYVYE